MTDYSRKVRHRLIDLDMTIKDLSVRVSQATGLYCDNALINRVLDGKNRNEKIINAINLILGV